MVLTVILWIVGIYFALFLLTQCAKELGAMAIVILLGAMAIIWIDVEGANTGPVLQFFTANP